MPLRLSRAGWNNVIIFSVMGFILLINLTQPKNEGQATASGVQSVIGEHSVILTMTVDQLVTIERVGQAWRITPERLPVQLVEQMMRSWHSAQGQVVDVDINRAEQQGIFVSMVLAGQQAIQMFTVYPVAEQLIVFNHQTGIYQSLPQPMYKQLFPVQLLTQ